MHRSLVNLTIVSSKFGEGACLLLENIHDIIDSIAVLEFPSERMIDQIRPYLFLIALQGGGEERIEARAKGVSHYTGRRTVYKKG